MRPALKVVDQVLGVDAEGVQDRGGKVGRGDGRVDHVGRTIVR